MTIRVSQRRKGAGVSIVIGPNVMDLYNYQELQPDGEDKGEAQRLSYIDARVKIQLAAPSLTNDYLNHVFALAHAANGGPIDVIDIDERKGALRFSARLSRVVP